MAASGRKVLNSESELMRFLAHTMVGRRAYQQHRAEGRPVDSFYVKLADKLPGVGAKIKSRRKYYRAYWLPPPQLAGGYYLDEGEFLICESEPQGRKSGGALMA